MLNLSRNSVSSTQSDTALFIWFADPWFKVNNFRLFPAVQFFSWIYHQKISMAITFFEIFLTIGIRTNSKNQKTKNMKSEMQKSSMLSRPSRRDDVLMNNLRPNSKILSESNPNLNWTLSRILYLKNNKKLILLGIFCKFRKLKRGQRCGTFFSEVWWKKKM